MTKSIKENVKSLLLCFDEKTLIDLAQALDNSFKIVNELGTWRAEYSSGSFYTLGGGDRPKDIAVQFLIKMYIEPKKEK